jgi:predicted RNase H-like nuclease (RuvC/YqgF family)
LFVSKEKLQNNHDSTSTLTSLNITVSEQRNKIVEYEETLEKLRSQRERMLTKMKEMKTNNELLTNQVDFKKYFSLKNLFLLA